MANDNNDLECQERGLNPDTKGSPRDRLRHSCRSSAEINAPSRAESDGNPRDLPRLGPINLPIREPLSERFWSKVRRGRPDECWPWTAGSRGNGYGAIKVGAKVVDAHVIAYELHHGARPLPGIWVTHKCDNRACCNPAHLVAGTPTDNFNDMVERGGAVPPEVVSERNKRLGIKPPRTAKLSEEQALLVIALAAEGWTHQRIAYEVDVSRPSVSKLLAGTYWPHLDRSPLAHLPKRTPRGSRVRTEPSHRKVCGACGGLGHNRRTCRATEAA